MKIAIICRRYYPEIGGVETHVKEIAERLVRNHQVSIFTLVGNKNLEGEENVGGVNVRKFKSIRLSYSAEIPPNSLSRQVEKFSPDIIHSHSAHTSIPFFASRIKCNSKFVVTPHYQGNATTLLRRLLFAAYKPLLGTALLKANRIICVSSAERIMLSTQFSIDQAKIRIIPNGVGTDLANIKRVEAPGEQRILSVARFDLHHKKTDKLIRAFKILDSGINAKLVLVGSGPDKYEIIRLIKELDLESKVEVKSNLTREELIQEYANASLFVTASEKEAFGIAVAEAVAARVKVIVPNTTALSLYVKSGHALGIEGPVNPETIAKSITQCLNASNPLRDYTPYTWDMVTHELENVYQELADRIC